MQIRLRLLAHKPPSIAWALTLAALTIHVWSPTTLHDPFPAAGAVLGFAGLAIMLRAWWLFRIADIGICPTDVTEELVVNDIYALTRNPMYLGMVLMLFGLAIATAALEFYAGAALLWGILNGVFCDFEEHKLDAQFGPTYALYRRRVRRWL